MSPTLYLSVACGLLTIPLSSFSFMVSLWAQREVIGNGHCVRNWEERNNAVTWWDFLDHIHVNFFVLSVCRSHSYIRIRRVSCILHLFLAKQREVYRYVFCMFTAVSTFTNLWGVLGHSGQEPPGLCRTSQLMLRLW
jgi:hypothetical protein